MSYQPSKETLEKYARVLVNFALNNGQGLKKGEVVYLQANLSALPLYRTLLKTIFDSGGHIITNLSDDMNDWERYYYDHATKENLTFMPRNYYKGLIADIDHRIAVLSDHDPHALDKVDAQKVTLKQKTRKPVIEWLDEKEKVGKHTWVLASYGTAAMAKEAGLSIKEYWQQIVEACYLDYADPIAKWKKTNNEIARVAKKLSDLKIEHLHVTGKDIDLKVKIGQNRRWLGGGGRNIPSFEVFTSPDWRGTEGWIYFDQPLTRYGLKVDGIRLDFKAGRVVKSSATRNEAFLKALLATDKGAAQLGEFSLTDRRLSKITKSMHDDLYDENMGGPFGNTHIAVGRSFEETFNGDSQKMNKAMASKLNFNQSVVHTDMISTSDRTVEATLIGGKQQVIYQKGQFTI